MNKLACAIVFRGQGLPALNSPRLVFLKPSSNCRACSSALNRFHERRLTISSTAWNVSQCSVSERSFSESACLGRCNEVTPAANQWARLVSGHQLLRQRGSRQAVFQHVLTNRRNSGIDLPAELPPYGQLRGFHTSPQRHIPPVFWFLVKPVAKLGAILTGRSARKWWRALPEDGRQKFWDRVRQKWYYIIIVAAGLGGAGLVYYKSHIEETPFTGRQRFMAVTHEQFIKIAEAEADGYLETYKETVLPPNHPYYERVQRVGDRLSASNPKMAELLGNTSWKYYIIDDPSVINAFVLPTGQVFVFTGILDFAQNDDQLAVIIAHEMAHALLSHGIEQVSYVQLIDFLIITTLAAIWCVMPTDGISIITQWFYNKIIYLMLHMPYSRMLEKEADKVGLQLAAKACYDVREASVFWARIGMNEDITEDDKLPEWLSTHPSHKKRVDFFDHMVPQAVQIREEAKCPLLPSRDPREAIKELSLLVDSHQTAKKTGQNLSRVQVQRYAS